MVYWGWVVCGCFLTLFTMTVGMLFSFSELTVPINNELHTKMVLLDWLGGLHIGIPMLCAPVATYIYYQKGTRLTVMVGVLGVSMCFALTALVSNPVMLFFILGVFGSSFMTLILNPPFFLLDEYFPYEHPRHVLATSLVACGFPLATLIFNPLSYEMAKGLGWRTTYSVYAILVFIVGTATTYTFKDVTIKSDEVNKETKSMLEKQQYQDPNQPDVKVKRRTKVIIGSIWFFASMFKTMGYYTPFMTLVIQMESMGIEPAKAASAMSVVGVCELVSRFITCYIGDYIKGKILYTYVAFTFLLSIQNAMGSLAYNYTQIIFYGAALGTLGGPIIAAMYSSCAEVLQGGDVPALFSIFRMGLGFGGIIGPAVAGGIFDATKSFNTVYYVNCFVYFLASALYVTIILLNKYRPSFVFPEGGISHQRFLNEHDEETIIMDSVPPSHKVVQNGDQNYALQNGVSESIAKLGSTQQNVLEEYKKRKAMNGIDAPSSDSSTEGES